MPSSLVRPSNNSGCTIPALESKPLTLDHQSDSQRLNLGLAEHTTAQKGMLRTCRAPSSFFDFANTRSNPTPWSASVHLGVLLFYRRKPKTTIAARFPCSRKQHKAPVPRSRTARPETLTLGQPDHFCASTCPRRGANTSGLLKLRQNKLASPCLRNLG